MNSIERQLLSSVMRKGKKSIILLASMAVGGPILFLLTMGIGHAFIKDEDKLFPIVFAGIALFVITFWVTVIRIWLKKDKPSDSEE